MGQGQGSNTSAILAAAGEAAEQLVGSVVAPNPVSSVTVSGAPDRQGETPASSAPTASR
jgi:hypothetical protein